MTFDIVVLTETWMSNAESQLYNIEGYMMLGKQHPLGKGRGICIHVKTCYDATIIEQKFNCLSDTFEYFEI